MGSLEGFDVIVEGEGIRLRVICLLVNQEGRDGARLQDLRRLVLRQREGCLLTLEHQADLTLTLTLTRG